MSNLPLNNRLVQAAIEANRTPEEHRVTPKVYFHSHNGAKFHFQHPGSTSCKTVMFANHKYITDDKREQAALNEVADHPGTFIYTMPDNEVVQYMKQQDDALQHEQVMQAAKAASEMAGRQFNPNEPIVPVHVAQSQVPAGMQVAHVGMQNSMSGTTGIEQTNKLDVQKTAQPGAGVTSATAEKLKQLDALAQKPAATT